MMKIAIYQVNLSRDYNRVAFLSLDGLEYYFGSKVIDSNIYDKVFDGYLDVKSLEDVYRFRDKIGNGFSGRPLSVSDVIEVIDDSGESTFYFCDSIGFPAVPFDSGLTHLGVSFS